MTTDKEAVQVEPMTEVKLLPTKLGEPINGVRQRVIDFDAALAERDATITALKSESADLKEAKNTARKIVARWMIDNSFATGHGDSIYDLLQSLESQVCEIRSENAKLREALELMLTHGEYSNWFANRGDEEVVDQARAALAKG